MNDAFAFSFCFSPNLSAAVEAIEHVMCDDSLVNYASWRTRVEKEMQELLDFRRYVFLGGVQ